MARVAMAAYDYACGIDPLVKRAVGANPNIGAKALGSRRASDNRLLVSALCAPLLAPAATCS